MTVIKEDRYTKDLVYRCLNGYKNNKDKAFIELLDVYKNSIRWIVSRFFIKGLDKEDLYTIAYSEIWNSLDKFNPDKGNFNNWLHLCVERRLITELKKSQQVTKFPEDKKIISIDSTVDYEGGTVFYEEGELALKNIIEDNNYTNDQAKEYFKILHTRLWPVLSKIERRVYLLYIKSFNYKEIEDKLNISIKSIDNALVRIKIKAKRIYKEFIIEENKEMTEEYENRKESMKAYQDKNKDKMRAYQKEYRDKKRLEKQENIQILEEIEENIEESIKKDTKIDKKIKYLDKKEKTYNKETEMTEEKSNKNVKQLKLELDNSWSMYGKYRFDIDIYNLKIKKVLEDIEILQNKINELNRME